MGRYMNEGAGPRAGRGRRSVVRGRQGEKPAEGASQQMSPASRAPDQQSPRPAEPQARRCPRPADVPGQPAEPQATGQPAEPQATGHPFPSASTEPSFLNNKGSVDADGKVGNWAGRSMLRAGQLYCTGPPGVQPPLHICLVPCPTEHDDHSTFVLLKAMWSSGHAERWTPRPHNDHS